MAKYKENTSTVGIWKGHAHEGIPCTDGFWETMTQGEALYLSPTITAPPQILLPLQLSSQNYSAILFHNEDFQTDFFAQAKWIKLP